MIKQSGNEFQDNDRCNTRCRGVDSLLKESHPLSLVRHHECGERVFVMCKRDGAKTNTFVIGSSHSENFQKRNKLR